MALNYTLTSTVTTASVSGCLRLFHGTLAAHIGSLCQGIDFTKGGGFFWTSPDVWAARNYADMAEQQLLVGGLSPGRHVILGFDLSVAVIDSFQGQQPEPWLVNYAQGFRFSQACSAALHSEMRNIEITFEE